MRKVSLPSTARWAILLGLAGLIVALVIAPPLARAQTGGTGTILREYWNNISGTAVTNLTSNANYPNNPTGSGQLTSLEGPTNAADNYGSRIRGYVHPPASGAYTFWLASDDSGELWLSTSDNPANAARIASVSGWTNAREWTKFASQQSAAISLTAGQKYYIEVLQKEGTGGDNVAVAWQGPGISQAVIAGAYLSPFGSEPQPETFSINAGGAATGSFTADQYFSGGSTYTNTATIDMSQITSTPPPAAVFSTERYGAMTYTIPNRTGAQTVTLYFAETYLSAAGQRVFNVSINGAAALSNFDIFASAGGANRAIARTFNTTANASGQVVIQFTAVTENPKINAITVAGGGPTPTTPPPTTPPVTTPPPTTPPVTTPPPTTPPPGSVSINAGGAATGSFTADQYFSGGSTYTNTATVDMSQVTANPPPAAVFSTERYGAMTYTIPNRTGAQTVTLYFAETYVTAAGQRVFNVSINGAAALSSFDIFASAGGTNRAIARTFNTTANASGQVVIQFTAVTENPKINAITVAGGGGNPSLTVSKGGTGAGTVTSSPSGINCGSACSATYPTGTSVTLTATPAGTNTFGGWSGACSGTSTTCTVTLTVSQGVTATFNTQTNSKIMGVNWADQRDNFVNGVLYVSGLSASDNYSSASTVASRVIGQMYSITGANTVRMPINEPTVSSYWSTYTGAIDTALGQGRVILAYWATSGGRPASNSAFYVMWDRVVAQYGSNPNAYFEVINEPHGYNATDLNNMYNDWLNRYSSVPRSRVILDGAGLAQDVPAVGRDSRLNGTLLAVHDYTMFASLESETEWANHIASYIGSYASRTVCTEWGGPMGPGSKDGVSYDTLDYSIPSGSFFVDYIRGVSSQLRTLGMGSVYWPGLRDGDWYSMTRKTGTGSNITLTLVNASGLTRLQYAWGIGNGGGTYVQIRNAATGLVLDGLGATADGSDAGQSTTTGSSNSQWVIENYGNYVRIRNRATGLYLDGAGRTANGSNVAQWSASTGNAQQWSVITEANNVLIRNRATGLYLDGMGRTTNGSIAGQYSSSTSANQRWRIVAAP